MRRPHSISVEVRPLLQCSDMADWRQIQARIRKAKNSPEALAKLSELYQRTRDGMVAWELGVIEEKAEHMTEAGNWYTIAAQRFRRADWKKKAEEALARLGIPLPEPGAPPAEPPAISETKPSAGLFPAAEEESSEAQPTLALGEIPMTAEETASAERPIFRARALPWAASAMSLLR